MNIAGLTPYSAGQPAISGLFALCLMLAVFHAHAEPAEQGNYIFGVFPYFSPVRLEEGWGPVAADLSAATGQRLHFRTASNYASFFDKLMRGDYDLALVQPFFYVAAVDEAGYLPVARVSQPFRSVVVVLASSPIEQVSDLRGKVIASPPLHVPAVHLARQAIRDHGLSPSEDMHFREYTSADSCLHQVMIGTADACVSGPIGAASFQTRHQVQFRTLIETIALPNLAVVAHPRVPAALRQQWGERLQALSRSSEGQTMLQQLNIPAFIHLVDSDYDVVRRFVYALDEPWLPTAN